MIEIVTERERPPILQKVQTNDTRHVGKRSFPIVRVENISLGTPLQVPSELDQFVQARSNPVRSRAKASLPLTEFATTCRQKKLFRSTARGCNAEFQDIMPLAT